MKNLIATIKSWNIENAKKLQDKDKENDWHLIADPKEFTLKRIQEINPKYIFMPHWSWIIPKEIWENYETIVFHSTDLPFGRGGSPIQNLIVREIYKTKISALRVNNGIDTGPVYMKEDFDISSGNIEEILKKGSEIIFKKMIPYIISNQPIPESQQGEPSRFQRRTPEQSNILTLKNTTAKKIYDHIRMLDGGGYPRAYIPLEQNRLECYDANFDGGQLTFKARLKKDE